MSDKILKLNQAQTLYQDLRERIEALPTSEDIPNVPVQDVQVNGVSVLNNGVANVPIMDVDKGTVGVARVDRTYGTSIYSQRIIISKATAAQIKNPSVSGGYYCPIVPYNQHESTFFGLAKAAGADMKDIAETTVGVYPNEQKAAIQNMLGVPSTSDLDLYATKSNTVLNDSLSSGRKTNTTIGTNSIAFGIDVEASGSYSLSIGRDSKATALASRAYGYKSSATNLYASAEGYETLASQTAAHAEGRSTKATATYSHAQGYNTTASGAESHSEGLNTEAKKQCAHAEGYASIADAVSSHAEGQQTITRGQSSHAENLGTIAEGFSSHAEGIFTKTTGDGSHVGGKYNIVDNYDAWPEWTANTEYTIGDKVKLTITENEETTVTGYICKVTNNDAEFISDNWNIDTYKNYAFITGNGTADDARSNAYTLEWTGTAHYAGDVYVNCSNDSTGGTRLATVTEVAAKLDAAEAGLKVVRLI